MSGGSPFLSSADRNVVMNLRNQLGDKVSWATDADLAAAWSDFSQSEDYPDMELFIRWVPGGPDEPG